MTADFQAETKKKMAALENWMAPFFAKAPHLPPHARQTVAGIAPWVALIFGVLGAFAILSSGAILSALSLSMFGGIMQLLWYVGLAANLAACVFELFAYQPLTKKLKKGWNLLFYSVALTTAASILDMTMGYGTPVSTLLGALIGFWLLFEIRSLYN